MITVEGFIEIRNEVIDALHEAFTIAKANSANNAYLLYLAEADYRLPIDGQGNPHTIDNRLDRYVDETRISYFVNFLNKYYSFTGGQPSTDDEETLYLDLMVYTHLWEAKAFLKKLYRLAQIIDAKDYIWKAEIPDFSKQDFYRNDIKAPLVNHGCKLAKVLTNGFHSSLRNAFAHSEFSLDFDEQKIWLDNFKGAAWELEDISFDDWSKRFTYSFLTSYFLFDLFYEARKGIAVDFYTTEFIVPLPQADGSNKSVDIVYIPQNDSFRFKYP